MAGLVFGTGGVPNSASNKSTLGGIERLTELGLGAMEIEFVQRVSMGEVSAREVARIAASKGIRLSAHAPYFINLNAREPDKLTASQYRLLHAARIAALCSAESVIFHAGFYLGDPHDKVYDMVKIHLAEVLEQLKQEDIKIWVRPETTGKETQFGTVEEVCRLSAELEGVAPCIDFAHLHARGGQCNTYQEFAGVLQRLKERLGDHALKNMHMHISGIKYTKKGEIGHLNFEEADLKYAELLQALKDYDAAGLAICESHNLEDDAMLMQTTYRNLESSR